MAMRTDINLYFMAEIFNFSFINILNLSFIHGWLHIPAKLPFIPDPVRVVEGYICHGADYFLLFFALGLPFILGINVIIYQLSKLDKYKKYKLHQIIFSIISFLVILTAGFISNNNLAEAPYARPNYDFELFGNWYNTSFCDMFFLAYAETLLILLSLWFILHCVESKLGDLKRAQ